MSILAVINAKNLAFQCLERKEKRKKQQLNKTIFDSYLENSSIVID